jgi:hypothetical protein
MSTGIYALKVDEVYTPCVGLHQQAGRDKLIDIFGDMTKSRDIRFLAMTRSASR